MVRPSTGRRRGCGPLHTGSQAGRPQGNGDTRQHKGPHGWDLGPRLGRTTRRMAILNHGNVLLRGRVTATPKSLPPPVQMERPTLKVTQDGDSYSLRWQVEKMYYTHLGQTFEVQYRRDAEDWGVSLRPGRASWGRSRGRESTPRSPAGTWAQQGTRQRSPLGCGGRVPVWSAGKGAEAQR